MVESDFLRDPATHHHHGRRHDTTPRDVDSDDVNSRDSEATPKGDAHDHHGEENPRKERDTEMTKRTATNLTSLAISLIFVFGSAASAARAESRNQCRDNSRASIRTEVRFDNQRGSRFGRDFRFYERRDNNFRTARRDFGFDNRGVDNRFQDFTSALRDRDQFGRAFKGDGFAARFGKDFASRFNRTTA
jgi:hypothetical protein